MYPDEIEACSKVSLCVDFSLASNAHAEFACHTRCFAGVKAIAAQVARDMFCLRHEAV